MMKPVVFVSLTLFCLVYAGNACMKTGFTTQASGDSGIRYASCAADEATLNRQHLQDFREGYLGDKRVTYSPMGDDSILIEGDMIMAVKGGTLPAKPLPQGISQGVGVIASGRWPTKQIAYKVPVGFPDKYRIDEAVATWNQNLPDVIRFVPWTNEAAYVSFVNTRPGCSSTVGYQGATMHEVNIDSVCSTGNVIHELGHVMGLHHEQNRLDRANFVTINYANILPGYENNFNVDAVRYANYMDYDFGSIMHYSLTAFSVDDIKPTISPKVSIPSGVVVGQRMAPSSGDVNSVRAIYGYAPIDVPVVGPGAGGGGVNGIAAAYFQRRDFNELKVSQLETGIDFNWGLTPPVSKISGSSFSVRFRGYFLPPTTGEYSFRVTSSGAFRLNADGTDIFNQPANAERHEYVSRYYALSAGSKIALIVDYQSMGVENGIKVEWTRPDGIQEVVPSSALLADDAQISELQNLCTVSGDSH